MNKNKIVTTSISLMMTLLSLSLVACQPKHPDEEQQNTVKTTALSAAQQFYIESETIKMPGVEALSCEKDGCTQYDIQTVKTNQPWIDQYFEQRLQKANPVAFQKKANNQPQPKPNERELTQNEATVRFLSQNQHLATFELWSYVYPAGAAHGSYHREFVNFDMKTRKRIALDQLLVAGSQQKVLNILYDQNAEWLQSHHIEKDKLQLSDNFYYGVNGVVFVYPLYELASYAEGMSELTLPYYQAKGVIKPQFLPSLAKYQTDK